MSFYHYSSFKYLGLLSKKKSTLEEYAGPIPLFVVPILSRTHRHALFTVRHVLSHTPRNIAQREQSVTRPPD